MVVVLSYIIAVLLTVAIAICLYPISAAFWLLGLLGKISDNMFSFTNKAIRSLWRDLRNSDITSGEQWVCSCGCSNVGKYCSSCGKASAATETPATPDDSEQI